MSNILISAAHKSSGKTTITIGLCAALTARKFIIQAFKKGPDYIDPLWLSQATKRPCHNLDFYTMTSEEIQHCVSRYSQTANLSIIEGNKGLYDGMDLDGSNSNAALAHLVNAPVILVIDTQGITRGVAPLILGYKMFDKDISIAGVILNQVGGERHENKLRAAVEYYTDVPVIGAVRRNKNLQIKERHLGLMPSNEDQKAQLKIQTIAQAIEEQVDLDRLLEMVPPVEAKNTVSITTITTDIKIGIIRDAAFGFYYQGDLEALEAAGAELVFIDALHDSHLPVIDGLFIGGGFPEENMEILANNKGLKQEIYDAVERFMPVYAECGGLMYLARRLTWRDKTCDMVGVLAFDTIMQERPVGRGYVHLRETGHGLWQGEQAEFYAHEFHYSKAVNVPENLKYAYEVIRGHGLDGCNDGVVYKNTVASYVHLRDVKNNRWAERFVEFVRNNNNKNYKLKSGSS